MTLPDVPRFCEVAVDIKAQDVDRAFDYAVPPELGAGLRLGHRVLVPFGRRPPLEGYVIGLRDATEVANTRPILRLLDPEPVLNAEMIATAKAVAADTLSLFVSVLQCFLPPGGRLRAARPAAARTQLGCALCIPPAEAERVAHDLARRAPKQAALVRALLRAGGEAAATELLAAADASHGALAALTQRGLVRRTELNRARRPQLGTDHGGAPAVALTPAQVEALAAIEALPGGETLLLHGVTGSGKTEVYLQAVTASLARGDGAIVLVPEISLTPQTWARFQSRFGDTVAVLHSRLSAGERYDEWQRVRRGEARVVIGSRSAVFAPMERIGLIILDEEHDASYKQDEAPRYHACAVAQHRARRHGARVVLGSATPSVESYTLAGGGHYRLAEMPERVGQAVLPPVEIVDLRAELRAGNRGVLSRRLFEALGERLARREQAILLLNRRGFAAFVLCRECGHTLQCEQCAVSLTFHQPARLVCHYCGYERALPERCPECGGPYLRAFGAGTQKLAAAVAEALPLARVARLDADAAGQKGAHERILSEFRAGRVDVLVGTQMVAKGLDFPRVTLVGVIAADAGLHLPDFRAAERTFQLLTQVAGRAGRGDWPGEVIVQTYSPEHPCVVFASRHDYRGFYGREAAYRRRTGYPPACRLARFLITGESEAEVTAAARRLGGLALEHCRQVERLGPAAAPLGRLHGRYRRHLLLRGAPEAVMAAAQALAAAWSGERRSGDDVRVAVDIDPLALL